MRIPGEPDNMKLFGPKSEEPHRILEWTVQTRVPKDLSHFIIISMNENQEVNVQAFGDPQVLLEMARNAQEGVVRLLGNAPPRGNN